MSRNRETVRAKPRKLDVGALLGEALALHQRGEVAKAEPIYRRVLAEDPDNAQATQLLGVVYLQRGDAASAVQLLAKAVDLEPDNPQYLGDLGVAQNAANMFEEALRSLNRAIDLRPDYAQAHSNLGMTLKNLGRHEAAVASYRRAINLRPSEAGFHLNLGNSLTAAGDLSEAETAYRKALELRPGYPAAVSGLALTLSHLGRSDEAIATGQKAIANNRNVAAYHFSLGRAYRDARQPEQAIACFRRALELDPGDMESVRYLALLEAKSAFDEELAALSSLFESGRLSNEQGVHLAYALATWLDDLGEYERAADYYARANGARAHSVPFSIDSERAVIEEILSLFDPMPDPGANGTGYAPIFVVGLPRSGKTTLEGMLSRHPRLQSAGELRVLALLGRELSQTYKLAAPGAHISRVPEDRFVKLREAYRRHAESIVSPSMRSIDTMPTNFRLIGLIRLAIPDAKILHCVRPRLEHCVALYKKSFGTGFSYTYDLNALADYYRLYERTMTFWKERIPGFVIDVDVADLLQRKDAGMRRIFEHCGVEYDEACLEPFESEPRRGSARSAKEGLEPALAPYRPVLERAFNA